MKLQMKRSILLAVVFLFAGTTVIQAQLSDEQKKERKEVIKASKEQLNEKASKVARDEAKKLAKAGWETAPGALPIEKQLDRSYLMQFEYDDEMYPKYIMAEGMSVAGNYDAAKMQAMELAKQNLAGQIQTEVTALVENTVANEQMSAEDAATLTRSIAAGKNLISQSIGRTLPVVEIYRTLKNKNKEVLVRIAYNGEMAKKLAKDAIRKQLAKEGEEKQKKLDELLGW